MLVNTTYRSNAIEIMDDLEMSGEQLVGALDKLGIINKYLGGNQLTIDGVLHLLKGHDMKKEVTIVDLGCGGGDILRVLADRAIKLGYKFKLIGIDANKSIIEYAENLSTSYDNISFLQCNIDSEEFKNLEYDIALSTLFLHHFECDKVIELIRQWSDRATIGVVVNDLHRHRIAYYLFNFITLFFGNEMVRNDGLLSVLKGFKYTDLKKYADALNYKSTIKWRWAFRYQWIIQN